MTKMKRQKKYLHLIRYVFKILWKKGDCAKVVDLWHEFILCPKRHFAAIKKSVVSKHCMPNKIFVKKIILNVSTSIYIQNFVTPFLDLVTWPYWHWEIDKWKNWKLVPWKMYIMYFNSLSFLYNVTSTLLLLDKFLCNCNIF